MAGSGQAVLRQENQRGHDSSGSRQAKKRKFGSRISEQAKRRKFKLKKLKFRKIKTWVLLLILAPLLFIDATLLRFNHIKMAELRDAVLAADESENDEAITEALTKLRDYTFSHIVINVIEENGQQRVTFGTGPFYLEHKYRRVANQAVEELQAQLADDSNPNGNIYQEASNICSPQAIANGWAWNSQEYISCMTGEIQKYPETEDFNTQISALTPSTELFRFNFASPVWAPTLTGFCLLITLVLIVVIFIRMIIWAVLQLSLLFI